MYNPNDIVQVVDPGSYEEHWGILVGEPGIVVKVEPTPQLPEKLGLLFVQFIGMRSPVGMFGARFKKVGHVEGVDHV